MKIQIISLFPEMFKAVLDQSMMFKAQKIGAVEFELIDLRQFGLGPRKQVDDTPYGGGDGMLLMIEPLMSAVEQAKANDPNTVVVLTSPKGQTFNQVMAEQLAQDGQAGQGLTFICGRYEGVDERIMTLVDQTISLGNFVLTGGELPVMTMIDAVVRLLPGVLGGEQSATIESFAGGENILEFPQYTRPAEFRGLKVPEVLLSGNHAEIAKWRAENSSRKTDENMLQ
jgi:tRNA (guanine-N(1)-)-methyltransferase